MDRAHALAVCLALFLVTPISAAASTRCSNRIDASRAGPVKTESRPVGAFDEIEVRGPIDVVLAPGSDAALSFEANEAILPHLTATIEDRRLILDLDACVEGPATIRADVTFKELTGLTVAGSGDVHATKPIRARALGIAINGSGDVVVAVETGELAVAINGSGDAELTGTTKAQRVAVRGSGEVRAKKLRAHSAEVVVNGSGQVTVYADQDLTAATTGSGQVIYYGKPKKVLGNGHVTPGE